MPKTSLKNFYLDRIASINDQFCYFNFADIQLNESIEGIPKEDYSKRTTELFRSNVNARRIDIEFENLLEFRLEAKQTISGVSVSFGFEQILYYLKDVTKLKIEISSTQESPTKADAPEERLYENLIIWGSDNPEPIIFKTLKYLRFRRNHILHKRSDLTPDFKKLLRVEGRNLNNYWRSNDNFKELDFSSVNVDVFTEEEVYCCMSLLRICLQEIDGMVADTLSKADLIKYVTRKVLEHNGSLKGQTSLLARKVSTRLLNDFDIKIKRVDVINNDSM